MIAKRKPNFIALFVVGIAFIGIGITVLPMGKQIGTLTLVFVVLGLLLMTIGSMGQKRTR